MKRTYIAAAALLLGTSAFAWAQSSEPVAKDPMAVEIVKPTVAEVVAAKDQAAQTKTAALSDEEAVLQPASLETWSDQPAPESADLDLSEDPDTTDTLAEPDVEATDTGMTDVSTAGVGGPEEVVTTAAADLTPRAAAHNYPPCSPGPGDDNCIQLYELGVRTALASWNQPTGGLAGSGEAFAAAEATDETATSAVGGPYEPTGASDTAWAGDGSVDPASGETAEVELASADTAQYTGMGGPIAETGYPPCSPGPGDDRCIQLYEPGVTGAGN